MGMRVPAKYLNDRKKVRAELIRLASEGELTYYQLLGAAVGKHKQWPLWKRVLDEISDDETRKEMPDITFLVLNAGTGWPSQIGFESTDSKPTPEEQQKARLELDKVFRRYCPNKPTPTLPKRRFRSAT
jgi:hypothetical protein